MHENRETSREARRLLAAGAVREGVSRNPGRNAGEESDRGEVSMKGSNKAEAPACEAAESLERRPRTTENTAPGSTSPTQSGVIVSPGLERVREKARKEKGARFTALFHHLTIDLLRASFWKLQKNAAAGVDGMRWREYATGLEERLADLIAGCNGAARTGPSHRAGKRLVIPSSGKAGAETIVEG